MDEVIDSVALRTAIGSNVRRLRLAHGWSQDELAERLEISRGQVNRIEMGRQAPSIENAFALADIFGVDVDSFRQIPAVTP